MSNTNNCVNSEAEMKLLVNREAWQLEKMRLEQAERAYYALRKQATTLGFPAVLLSLGSLLYLFSQPVAHPLSYVGLGVLVTLWTLGAFISVSSFWGNELPSLTRGSLFIDGNRFAAEHNVYRQLIIDAVAFIDGHLAATRQINLKIKWGLGLLTTTGLISAVLALSHIL